MSDISNSDRLIRVEDKTYPLYLSQIRRQLQTKSLPVTPTTEQLSDLGYEVVMDVEQPVGDVVIEGAPELIDGVWYKTYTARPFNQQELDAQFNSAKQELYSKIVNKTNAMLKTGIEFDFGGEDGIQHIQLRDGDRANLAGLRIQADTRITNNNDSPFIFRTLENNNIIMTPEEIVAMTDAALVGYYGILNEVWTLKDQVDNATNISELPTIE